MSVSALFKIVAMVIGAAAAAEDLQLMQLRAELNAESSKAQSPSVVDKKMRPERTDAVDDYDDEGDEAKLHEFALAYKADAGKRLHASEVEANVEQATPIHVWPMDGEDYIEWQICNTSYHSNLGGQGPDEGEEALRYPSLVRVRDDDGNPWELDLVISTMSEYRAKDLSANGLVDPHLCYGQVNVKSNSTGTNWVDLQFAWYMAGTTRPVALSKQYFTMFDIDGNRKSFEGVTFWNDVRSVHASNTTDLKRTGDLETGLMFSAEGLFNNPDLPRDPDNMTQEQKDRAVTVSYIDQSRFKLTFSVTGGNGGRNFAFTGHNTLAEDGGGDGLSGRATPSPTTCAEAGTCSIYEDPHIKVFDGMQISLLSSGKQRVMADYGYGSGDMWLVRSPNISIQGRYLPDSDLPESNMFVRAVAIGGPFLNGNTLIIGPLEEDISWNGYSILETKTSDFQTDTGMGLVSAKRHADSHLVQDITQTNAGVDVSLPLGVTLTVNRYRKHVNIFIQMPHVAGGQDGLCGNFNCEAADDTLDMILTHRSPKVLSGDSLFPQ